MALTKVTNSMTSGAAINVMDFIPRGEHSAIYDYTSTYDAGSDIQSALDLAATKEGATINIPAGLFNTTTTINLKSYSNLQGVYGEDGTYGVQNFQRGTQIKWIGANTTDPVIRIFNARLTKFSGINIDGDNKNVKGILLDSDNTPSGSQNEFHRFSIRRCLIGVEWGTGGLANPYANDGTRWSTFTIWSQMTGSLGFRINSGNAGQMSTIESGGIQVDTICIDLICANLLQIRRVFGGGQVRNSFIRAQLPIDVMVEGCSSENWGNRTDSLISSAAYFLLVIPSVEQPTFQLRNFTMTLQNNQCNNPILVQAPIRIVDIGSNFGHCYNASNVAIAATGTVQSAGDGSLVTVMNSGTHTYQTGYPYASGWQVSDYVQLTNIDPEGSTFHQTEVAAFPAEFNGVDRGIACAMSAIGGGYASYFTVANTYVGAVRCTATDALYETASDHRLKENAQPLVGATEQVKSLKPVSYTWKKNGATGIGFIAHELQQVIPSAVSGEKDGVDIENEPVYQAVDLSRVVPILTASLKEALARIDTLENKV